MQHLKILLVVLSFQFTALAQTQSNSYFVVIGTFKMMDNAIRFTAEANRNGLVAQYALRPATGLYYVYILETKDHVKAYDLSIRIKEETDFKNAWVYAGKLGIENDSMTPSDARVARANETETKLNANSDESSNKNGSVSVNATSKPFYFRVLSGSDKREIFGKLILQETGDPSPSNYRIIKSGEVVQVEEPQGKQKSYSIAALLPGYKQGSIVFFYDNPPIETGPNQEDIITLTLDKAKSPDFIEFNHVHFYKNTATLRPISHNELNELAELLKENSKCKIVIHGHYCRGMQDQEPYQNNTNLKEIASITDVSRARAETVKAYLIEKGIHPSRIRAMGEGILLDTSDGIINQKYDCVEIEFEKNSVVSAL